MILSASRRTDIPAFYGEWLEQRLREGVVQIPAPYRPHTVKELHFTPENIDCIVFWTKNILPFLPRLDTIRQMGYHFYIQHTLTAYDNRIEPGLPDKTGILEGIRRAGATFGPDAIVWRYDPIFFDAEHTPEWHAEQFASLCKELQGRVCRCVISFLDPYPGRTGKFPEPQQFQMEQTAKLLGQIAACCHMELFTCAEAGDYGRFGIRKGSCIDPVLVQKAAGSPLLLKKDTGQRSACGCMKSLDIGIYGSCPHRCGYCYASGSRSLSRMVHNPASLRLLGEQHPEDKITIEEAFSCRIAEQFSLF